MFRFVSKKEGLDCITKTQAKLKTLSKFVGVAQLVNFLQLASPGILRIHLNWILRVGKAQRAKAVVADSARQWDAT